MSCDHLVGWKIIEDEDIGEELYFPAFESDEVEDLDEEFVYCPYCGELL